MRPDRAKLLLPCAFACAADVTMTLAGQPAAYWAGDRSAAVDFNPVVRPLLALHPAAFPLAGAAGLIALALLLHRLPGRHLAHLLAFGVTFVQATGAAGWLVRHGMAGWAAALAVLVAAERLWAWATRRGCSDEGR